MPFSAVSEELAKIESAIIEFRIEELRVDQKEGKGCCAGFQPKMAKAELLFRTFHFFFSKRESRISAQLVKQGNAILSNDDQTKLAANNAQNRMQEERQMAAD